jgi:membrane-bound metal-dependent hydrolase YbcI (DUF457 family)
VSTPIGHTLAGLTLARRLGVRSKRSLAACVVAASLPDGDIIAGRLLHGDGWQIHRGPTHGVSFAAAAGALAGLAGLITTRAQGERRDLLRDALTGAAIAGSHAVLDELWFPYPPRRWSRRLGTLAGPPLAHWLADLAVYGAVAWKYWPRRRARVNTAHD